MRKETKATSSEPEGQAPTTAFLLSQVGAQVGIRFSERLSEHGITPPQVGILFMLARKEGVNQRFLANELGVVPSRLVVLVDELVGAGLIERGPNTPDRRTHAINLTAAGRVMLKSLEAMTLEHDEMLLAVLSVEEKAQLRRLLERIADQEGLSSGVHPSYRLLGPRKK